MDYQPDIATDPNRPEVLVLRLIELMETHSRVGRVDLQIEGRRLDGLLLIAGQSSKTVSECFSDYELQDWPFIIDEA